MDLAAFFAGQQGKALILPRLSPSDLLAVGATCRGVRAAIHQVFADTVVRELPWLTDGLQAAMDMRTRFCVLKPVVCRQLSRYLGKHELSLSLACTELGEYYRRGEQCLFEALLPKGAVPAGCKSLAECLVDPRAPELFSKVTMVTVKSRKYEPFIISGVEHLPCLEQLWTLHSSAVGITHRIGRCAELTTIVVTGSRLSLLPDEITSLPKLKTLSASNNMLQESPAGLGRMKLETLDLDDNPRCVGESTSDESK